MGRTLLVLLAGLIYVIAGIHLLAHWLFLYWTYPWLDSVMHTLAGLWISLFILWLVHHSPYREGISHHVALVHKHGNALIVLGSTFVFGVLWELYQLSAHILFDIPFKPDHLADSVSDVLFGIMGAGVGLMLYRLFGGKQGAKSHAKE